MIRRQKIPNSNTYIVAYIEYIVRGMNTVDRAQTVTHVEYEVLDWILHNIDVAELHEVMATDETSEKRFKTGVTNVTKLIYNLADRRKHRLPKTHSDYKPKEAQPNDKNTRKKKSV